MRLTPTALAAAIIALGGASLALERAAGPALPSWIASAYAQEHTGGSGGGGETGGHDSGGESGSSGGHGSGGGHGGGGMGGGHTPGAETGGEEAKGHGTRYQHQGHGSGRHGNTSSHESGADRFGGGSGLRGNAQVPEGIGRNGGGISAAAAATSASGFGRFRYWGGWTLPADPNEPSFTEPSVATTELTPGPGGGPSVNVRSTLDTSPRCEGVAPGMPAAQQLGGSNLMRLNAARALVDPSLAQSGKIASPYIMANLQEQLARGTPSTELAGTYLGLVAKAPVSAETVKQVGFQLCVRISDEGAKEIARVAEQQRMALISALKAGRGSGSAKPR